MSTPRILVFASGSAEGGGSGFQKLAEASRIGSLAAEIVAVVSNHLNGGVRKKADALGIPFLYFPKPWTAERYQRFAQDTRADFFALSGWLKLIAGLDPTTCFNSRSVFNIHPGPLPDFGGSGLYGHHVHEAVMAAFLRGEITHSAVSMHFVTEEYDRGPVFFQFKVKIRDDDTPSSLAQRINYWEHHWQPRITHLVVHNLINWDGVHYNSLHYPSDYLIEQFEY